ncbi:hemagglutinin repeat-containing protein [Cupriavidus sp. BIS7]|uniref:two-partner secretion domain-containing protein n=1 Tax=Cupriavidus sp. BIS7 TaxID=1217718 RepID=UPI00030C330A|nr:hemagglutinin repeat-containing protein [Cupriavidus sp. BIS7]
MNNKFFRIVFNRHRGQLMAVGEHVSGAAKAPGGTDRTDAAGRRPLLATLRPVAFALWLTFGLVGQSAAQIVADPGAPRNQQPTILNAPNGTPLVNIQTPSAAGVSRNTYGQFDVNANGAILNNSRTNSQTQLGGWVQGNPWLAGGTARVILNEVNGSHASQLRGYVEVAGDRAQVVIANPAGITCDGCGFLNANRATMTTGTPIMRGGSLEGYRVQRGVVGIGGAGMDASRADYTDIIARAVQVNAGIWARQIQITTGANEVSATSAATSAAITRAIPTAGTGPAPAYALDVSALGGMYAGKIALIGTEHGLGMRNAGHIGAQAGELVVTADGRLENVGTMQSRDAVRIAARAGVTNAGTISAARELLIHTPAEIDNREGTLNAQRIDVNAASLDNRGGAIEQSGLQALALQAGTLSNRDGGRIGVAEADDHTGTDSAGESNESDTTNGTAGAERGTGNSSGDDTSSGDTAPPAPTPMLADGVLRIAGHLDNDGGRIRAGGAIDLQTAAGLTNDGGQIALRDLTTHGGDLHNRGGDLTISGTAALQARDLLNDGGQIAVGGALAVSADSLSNRGGKLLHSGTGAASVQIGGHLDNASGTIASNASQLSLGAGSLDNRGGQVAAGAVLSASIGQTLDNTGGAIVAEGNLSLQAGALSNRDQGVIASASGDLTLAAEGAIDNDGGTLQAGANLALTSAGLTNARGAIIGASTSIDTQGQALDNTHGTVAATDGTLDVRSGALNNDGGLMQASGALSVDTSGQSLANANGGHIGSAASLALTAGKIDNSGTIQARELALRANGIDNNATGQIVGGRTHLTAEATVTNRGLIDGAATRIDAHTLDNVGTGRIYGDHLAIQADSVRNREESVNGTTSAASIAARERLDIGTRTLRNQEQALLFSAGTDADALNIGGALDADGHATGRAEHVHNASATIESLGGLTLKASVLRNTNEHFAIERVQVKGPNRSLTIQPKGDPSQYDASDFTWEDWSHAGRYRSKDGAEITNWTQYDITTTEYEDRVSQSAPAMIRAGGAMHLEGDDLVNDKSQIIVGGTLSGSLDALQTIDADGEHVIHREGTSQYTFAEWRGGFRRYHQRNWDPKVAYTPADVVTSTKLGVAGTRENASSPGSNYAIDGRNVGGSRSITETPVDAGGGRGVVRTVDANTDIPANSLFRAAPSSSGYLIETDPRFADYRQWLSSDYMLGQLGLDPSTLQKRLGDGFHEQRLVREQIGQLTGRRFLDGYASDEAQYRALLTDGATFAKQWNLRPGVALSAEQMAQLTSDIVWLVERPVTLPDGTRTTALVPQVYVRAKPGDLNGNGTLISADVVDLQLKSDLRNSGTIAGRSAVRISGENLRNLGGRITGESVALQASQDIDNIGGTIDAASALAVMAGRDLNLASTTRSDTKASGQSSFSRTNLDRVAGLYVTNPGGTLVAMAGRDANLQGAQIANGGEDGKTVIAAGRDLNLGTVQVGVQENNVRNASNYLRQGSTQEIGTSIQASGDVTLSAGRDLNARAAQVTSDQGAVAAVAGRDASLTAGENTSTWSEGRQHKRSGLLGGSSSTTRNSVSETTAQAATFSGRTVDVHAGRDINVIGSNVVSDAGTTLLAKNDIHIGAAQNTTTESYFKETKKSGFLHSGGAAFTLGTQQQRTDARSTRTSAAASTVGSTGGDVTLVAGNHYRQTGSHVVAPQGDIDILAKRVDIVEARETGHSVEESRFRQTGLTVAVTSPVISVAQTAQQMKRAAGKTSDSRMQALAGVTTALAAKNAADAIQADPAAAGGIGVSVSLGTSRSDSRTTTRSDTAAGSTVAAGGDVRIRATGAGDDSNLTIRGSNVSAGGDLGLKADGKVALLAADNVSQMDRKSSGSSAGVGVSAQIGAKGPAQVGVTVSASGSRGTGSSTDITRTNTRVTAGKTLSIESGSDTTLAGAVVSGKRVIGDIGGNLNIESLQDIHDYRSKDRSLGGSLTFGGGAVSGSINVGQQKIDSDYASVTGQSGIKAGDDGFQIRVKGNTSLKGGVIASTGKAVEDGLNRLDTGTLTHDDIENRASFKASGISLGAGFTSRGSSEAKGRDGSDGSSGGNTSGNPGGVGTNQQGQAATGGDKVPGSDLPSLGGLSAAPPIVLGASGKARSTTRSGISGAAVTIRDADGQQALTGQSIDEALAGLNRDVSSEVDGTNALKPIFDEKEIKAGFEIVGALQRETGAFLNNRAKEADALKLARDKETDPARRAELDQQYQDAAKWGPGGSYRRVATALTAAAGGNVTGSTAQFVQNAAVGYLQGLGANQVKGLADSLGKGTPQAEAARAALHAIVGCAGAAGASQACGAGAMGAAASSVIGSLLSPPEGLTSGQKQARENAIQSLVAGVAGVAGGDAATATNAATFEAENNLLFVPPLLVAAGKAVAGGAAFCATRQTLCQRGLDATRLAGVSFAAWLGAQMTSSKPEDGGGVIGTPNNGPKGGTNTTTPNDGPQRGTVVGTPDQGPQGGAVIGTPNNGPQDGNVIGTPNDGPLTNDPLLAGGDGYRPNAGSVGNMNEFLNSDGFGTQLNDSLRKTPQQFQGQSIYKATDDIGSYIKEGDQIYLDGLHKNHLEVFDKRGHVRAVLNLDGTLNRDKTDAAKMAGRKLRK